MFNEYLLTLDGIACACIALSLMAYRRKGSVHRPIATCFAYVLLVSCASVTIRILTGDYIHADWSETLINVTLCIVVLRARGNVMRIMNPELR